MKKLSVLFITVLLLTALVVSPAFAQKSEHQLGKGVSDMGVVGRDISANGQLMAGTTSDAFIFYNSFYIYSPLLRRERAMQAYTVYFPLVRDHVQGITYSVNLAIMNLDDSNSANITIRTYNESDGSLEAELTTTIPAGDRMTIAILEDVKIPFEGSAVIQSTTEIALIGNVFSASGMGSNTIFTSGETSVNLPLVMRNNYNFNTWFNVQNVGSFATTVTVTYSNNTTESATIQPGAAKTFDQASNSDLGDTFVGSAMIESDGEPIVAIVLEQGPTTLLTYNALRSGETSTNPVIPLVNNHNFGFMTGIQIQNTGDTNTDVTVSYTASLEGTDCAETKTVPANDSVSFAIYAFSSSQSGENCIDGETFIGSASVTSNSTNQPLVGVVNQLNSNANKAAAYTAFHANRGTSRVELPLIMDRNFGYFTGFSIINVGTSTTNLICYYTGSNVTHSAKNVLPGEALTVINGGAIDDRYVGAGTCIANGSIVGIVNELNFSASSDSFLVYEGYNFNLDQ